MSEEAVTDIDQFNAPWGKELTLQEVAYEGGATFLRIRIREGRRITIMEVDPGTARHWAGRMSAYADRHDG